MKGTMLYGPRDIRFEELETPKIIEPKDAVIRMAATCVCGSDLWPYRGLQPTNGPTPLGHEYCGFVEEVGNAVKSVKPGQFVIGSFATSDNTCPFTRLPVRNVSSSPGRKRPFSACHWRTEHWCRRQSYRPMPWCQAY